MKLVQTLINIFFLAGTTLLLIFTVLSGSTNSFPFKDFYFLKADTSQIAGASSESVWSFWGVCNAGNLTDCRLGPAYPISPVDNFGTSANIPTDFVNNRDTYYYLTRFSFAFLIIALCFTAFALILDIFGLIFSAVDKVVVGLIGVGLFFLAGTAAFETAVVVLARNAFHSSNLSASIGVKLIAFLWASLVALFIAFMNATFFTILGSYNKHLTRVRAEQQTGAYDATAADNSSFTRSAPVDPAIKHEDNGGIRFFKIKRNQKTSDEESV